MKSLLLLALGSLVLVTTGGAAPPDTTVVLKGTHLCCGQCVRAVGTILAKVEYLNPGGSVKDRIALRMIEAAERSGELRPGGTIVEPTSGNTGVGLAIVAAQRGYRCIFVMSDKMSDEKVALLRAYGAEVVVTPTAVAPEHPDSYYSTAERLVRETPDSFRPDQYSNPANPAEHERSTGPEVWRQTAGRITHFVAGIGTGGSITGVGRYLKAQNPDVQVVGADPEGSVYSGGAGRPYLVEGVGEDFWPTTYDPTVVDRVIRVSDAESFAMARRVTSEPTVDVSSRSSAARSSRASSSSPACGATATTAARAPSTFTCGGCAPSSGRGPTRSSRRCATSATR